MRRPSPTESGILEIDAYGSDYLLQLESHLPVAEPQYAVSESLEVEPALLVGSSPVMPVAVDLYYEPTGMADEVDDVRPDGLLATESPSECIAPQPLPKRNFFQGEAAAQVPGPFRCLPIMRPSVHRTKPAPPKGRM